MMENCLFESRPDHRRKSPFTLVMSVIVHVTMISALIVLPLMQIQAMPPIAPPPPVRSAGPQVHILKLASTPPSGNPTRSSVQPRLDILVEPPSIPREVAIIQDGLDASIGDSLRPGFGALPGTSPLFIPGGDPLPKIAAAAPPPPPPLPPAPPEPKIIIREPIRVSSTIQKSHLLKQIDPAYPPLARLAHVEGAVILEARITETGTVEGLHVISGNPLLVPSVIDAVKQWRYEPTLLNGTPVEVLTTITVNFSLK